MHKSNRGRYIWKKHACHSYFVSAYSIFHASSTRTELQNHCTESTDEGNKMPRGKKKEKKKEATEVKGFPGNLPVLILEDELPQFEVAEDQPVVMAMRDSRGYLKEEPGGLVLPQLLAGADERVHVAVAPVEEHVGPRLSEQDLQDLVDVLMLAQGEVGRQ